MTKLLFENLQIFLPSSEALAGTLEIPAIKPTTDIPDCGCIGFNCAMSCKAPENAGLHFFLDDYQFVRLWNTPDKYIPTLAKFRYLCAPDFSTYSDMPKVLQMYNHYRKHWLAAYWQELGMTVIPTISWSTPDSFSWCFDGEPEGGIVAIGTEQEPKGAKQAARLSWRATTPCWHGSIPVRFFYLARCLKESAATYGLWETPQRKDSERRCNYGRQRCKRRRTIQQRWKRYGSQKPNERREVCLYQNSHIHQGQHQQNEPFRT